MKLLVWLFSVSALVLAAVCIFVLVRYDIALLAAVSCLAVAMIVSAAASIPSREDGNARLNSMLSQRLGKNTNDIESLSRRIADQAQRLTDLGSRIENGKAEPAPQDKPWPYPAAQRPPKKTAGAGHASVPRAEAVDPCPDAAPAAGAAFSRAGGSPGRGANGLLQGKLPPARPISCRSHPHYSLFRPASGQRPEQSLGSVT